MTYPDLSALVEFPGWQAARTTGAAGPGPGPEALRRAYLELLKLCLCDLAGSRTTSVGKWADGSVTSRELSGEERRLRAAGMDWPQHGLTMIGLNRLDDLQSCVESVVGDGVDGDLIEAGAWRGGASILMRATLDSLGAGERAVWVADSFQGFPAADDQGHLNAMDFLAVPLEEVQANFARFGLDRGVRFVPGFFAETLPGLAASRWSLLRLDGDTYDATWTTLTSLYPALSVGGYVIADDYRAMPECGQAVDDFRRRHRIAEPLEDVDWTCTRWRRASEAPLSPDRPPARRPAVGAAAAARRRALHRTPGLPVPTQREQALEQELAVAHERLAAAEQEVHRLCGAPLRGPRAWWRQHVRRGGPSA